jgi:hypothetical protein
VNCTFCSNENPAHANFCWNCGAPLDLKTCPQCEWLNEQVATHCSKCATALADKEPAPIEATEFSASPKATQPEIPPTPSRSSKEQESLQSLLAQLKDDVNRLTATRTVVEAIPTVEPVEHAPHALARLPDVRRDTVVITPVASLGSNWYTLIMVVALAAGAALGYYAYQQQRETPHAASGTIVVPAAGPKPSAGQAPAPSAAAATVATTLPPTADHAGGEAASLVQHTPAVAAPSKEAVEEHAPAAVPKRAAPRAAPSPTAEAVILPASAPPVARTVNTQAEATPARAALPITQQPATSTPIPCTEAARAMGLCDGSPAKQKNSSLEEQK